MKRAKEDLSFGEVLRGPRVIQRFLPNPSERHSLRFGNSPVGVMPNVNRCPAHTQLPVCTDPRKPHTHEGPGVHVHTLGTNIPQVPIRYATHRRCVHTRQAAHPETPISEGSTPKHPQSPDANTPSRGAHTSAERHAPKGTHRDLGKGEGRRADAPRATPPSARAGPSLPFPGPQPGVSRQPTPFPAE